MPRITTKGGVEIFYKDWGTGQPIVFSHGWPLSADDWDTRCCSFSVKAIASSPMIAADMADLPRQGTATTWTTMPPISRPSPSTSTSRMPSTSAIPPVAVR